MASQLAVAASKQPQIRMSTLYQPTLVAVKVTNGSGSYDYQVPKGLICGRSKYFATAFNDRFKEGKEGAIVLENEDDRCFQVFLAWLYTNKLSWESDEDVSNVEAREVDDTGVRIEGLTNQQDGGTVAKEVHGHPQENHAEDYPPTGEDCDDLESADEWVSDDEGSEHSEEDHFDSSNATTWYWRQLFMLFVFGDKYDTQGFRTAVMEAIQIKALNYRPGRTKWPAYSDLAYLFSNLPATSPLYIFWMENIVYQLVPRKMSETRELEVLPAEAMAKIMTMSIQVLRYNACPYRCVDGRYCDDGSHSDIRPEYRYDLCTYHEHSTDEEKELCRAKWKMLIRKYNFDAKYHRGRDDSLSLPRRPY